MQKPMKGRPTHIPLHWRVSRGAVLGVIITALLLSLAGWLLYRDARQGCIRGFRGGCDPAVSFPRTR